MSVSRSSNIFGSANVVLWKIRPPIAVVNTMIESTRTNVARSMVEAPDAAFFAPAAPARAAARPSRPDHTKAA